MQSSEKTPSRDPASKQRPWMGHYMNSVWLGNKLLNCVSQVMLKENSEAVMTLQGETCMYKKVLLEI